MNITVTEYYWRVNHVYFNCYLTKEYISFCDGRNLGDIFSCPEFSIVRLDTMNGFSEWTANVLSWQAKTAWPRLGVQFVSATDRIDRPSHFKDCVAIAMCLIVDLLFAFLIEVFWLLYCVIYSQCKIRQVETQDNRKCTFTTDGILEQNSVRRTFKCVAAVSRLIMAACASLVFLWSVMVVYPYIKCLGFWPKERKGNWKKKILSVAMMTNVGFGPIDLSKCTVIF